jgi:hypothetical protein
LLVREGSDQAVATFVGEQPEHREGTRVDGSSARAFPSEFANHVNKRGVMAHGGEANRGNGSDGRAGPTGGARAAPLRLAQSLTAVPPACAGSVFASAIHCRSMRAS